MRYLFAVLFVATFAAGAAEPLISVKGLRAGMTPAEAKAMHPALKCSDPDPSGVSSCRYELSQNYEPSAELASVAGFSTREWQINFYAGKLDKLRVVFYQNHDDEILAALTQKFGKPHRTEVPMQNAAGARWNDTGYEWRRSGDEMFLPHIVFPETPSALLMTSADYNRRAEQYTKEVAPKRAKDL